MKSIKLVIYPEQIEITAEPGQTIAEVLRNSGYGLEMPCGGAGTCGKCLVRIIEPESIVKACQYHVSHDLEIELLRKDSIRNQILADFHLEGISIAPMVQKLEFQVTPPDLDDLRSDARRIEDTLSRLLNRPISFQPEALRSMPLICRDADWMITAVVCNDMIIAVEPGDTTGSLYGIALDIGTTTLAAALIDLSNGGILATASDTNPQRVYGDDVISRIDYTRDYLDGLEQMHQAIIDATNRLIGKLCRECNIEHHQVYALTAAGNATMQHIFWNAAVHQIGQAPYVAGFTSSIICDADHLQIQINPHGKVVILPGVAGHVGGDTVAVALTTNLKKLGPLTLAIDIGTNGEIVLAGRGRILTCSTAAGPAFEGARIRHGMRGATGAIERVRFEDNIQMRTIGRVSPKGICGSGLIDIVAEMLRVGMIDASGRMLESHEWPKSIPSGFKSRLIHRDGQPALILADATESASGEPILITQRDIRETQLAKAAIRAGIDVLLKTVDAAIDNLDRVYLAGAFGNYIDPASARAIGLLPDIELDQFAPVGNAAGRGAAIVLANRDSLSRIVELAEEMMYVELAGGVGFQNIFMDYMGFERG